MPACASLDLANLTGELFSQGIALPVSPCVDLPPGAGLRLAIRRSLRVGARAGIPVEDLGVRADHMRPVTRRDLLDANADLLAFTESLLMGG